MKNADVIDLLREAAKTVVEALEDDARLEVTDDEEHLKRICRVVSSFSGLLERQSVSAGDREQFEQGMKGFARELFLRRCRSARGNDEDADDADEIEEDRRYFEKLYSARRRRRKASD